MLLTIDIGNTQVAAGLFLRDELVSHWRLSSMYDRTEDETWILMRSICKAHGYEIEKAEGVVISSVVPGMTPTFEKMTKKYLKSEPLVVNQDLDIGIKNLYENVASVGADRLVNAVAGYEFYGGPLIIVDLGTATTFDVITEKGEYLGGIIAPGIEMSANILHQRAAKLPRVELKFPDRIIGNSTESSMQSGLMFGSVELICGMIDRIKKELGQEAKVIATGGLARLLIGELPSILKVESFLTLQGLNIIYNRLK
jgi:type III pantothenate kinase